MFRESSVTPSHLTDMTEEDAPGSRNFMRDHSGNNSKRKQTLLTLLDALQELSKDDEVLGYDTRDKPSFEDDRDVPSVDERLQVAGAESFNRFQKKINNLDKELRNFANAARQLGSSIGILSSAFHLRERLAQILFLFRENAANLFPRKVQRQGRETSMINPNFTRHNRRRRKNGPVHIPRPSPDDNLDPENFPDQIEQFAVDVTTFLNCLNEFPEFTDEAVNASILSFEGDLKYWASCLQQYKSQFRYPAVQRYLHDLTGEMGDHLDNITSTLSMFIEIGVPTIRFAQKHGASNLLNLSTVATFFSAVTATTMQFSYDQKGTPMSDAVNAFWFSSLVFSIAAAVNSLLGLTWKQAMYRSPGHRVPWWVLIWIKRSPLVFLVFSVACFSVGLVLFTYSSQQSHVTSTITTVFTAFTSFGLAAVSTWFASERWAYTHHQGRKWLGDILADATDRFYRLRGMVITRHALIWSGERLKDAGQSLKRVPSITASFLAYNGDKTEDKEMANATLPFANTREPTPYNQGSEPAQSASTTDVGASSGRLQSSNGHSEGATTSVVGSTSTTQHGKGRLAALVRSMIMFQSASPASPIFPHTPRRQRTTSSSGQEVFGKKQTVDPAGTLRGSRVATLIPKLKGLEARDDLAAHQALVRHLQFSPDGKFLATSSWDRTCVIFRVGDPFSCHRILAHPQGFVGQVAWSPSGNILLTKLNRKIKVWTEDGVCKKTIDRQRTVQSIAWLPGGDGFVSVEGSFVTKLDLSGKVLAAYHFEKMMLHDVAVTPDGQRLLGVGPLLASPTGLHPSKSRVEKRLTIYNMETKQCENQTPVLNDVRDITIAKNGVVALVSYENKAAPQLWRLEMVKDRDDSAVSTARLSLRHTFMPKVPVDFAGPSYFGGKEDQLVLCASKAGDIHIWDRVSAVLLRHIRAQDVGGDLTCLAWNPAAENPFMFAAGSHDGAVRIWSSPVPTFSIQNEGGSHTESHTQLRPQPHADPHANPFTQAETMHDTRNHAMETSHFHSDVEYVRSESPAQLESDWQHTHSGSDKGSSRERTVAFAAP